MVTNNLPVFLATRSVNILAVIFLVIVLLGIIPASAAFGDGSDGDVVISTATTLTSDMNYNSLTVNTGITLYPNGYAIYVDDTLTLNGVIARNGNSGGAGSAGSYNGPPGSPGSGGSALPTRSVGGSASGGVGGYGSASGSGSSGSSGGGISHGIAGSSGSSGSSGSAATHSGGLGGSGGSSTNTYTVTSDNIGDIFTFASTRRGGAAGGGGGGGSWQFQSSSYLSGGGGGGGGSGGGVVFIAANTIVGTGSVCANGGSGGSGGGSGGPYGGSGGGGGGGAVVIEYNEISSFSGSINVNGGSGGASGSCGDIFWIYSAMPEYVYWNQSSYSVGDTGSMTYSIVGYDPGTYDYSIDIFKGSSFLSYCHLSSGEGNTSYLFSDVVEPVMYYAKLTKRAKGSSIPLVITTGNCTVSPSDVSIVFHQSIYGPDDLVSISYYNCPNGSKIISQDDISPHQVSNTWVDISGSGSMSYQLSNADANRVFYVKVYSVSNIVLASDYMQIDDISSGYCQVHGGIYDSQDYHPLIGTVFIGDSYSDVVGYSDYGAYSIIVPWGTYDISAVVSSYLTCNVFDVVISGTDYDLNMFLSVNDTTTHVFRGSVTNADTHVAVDDVFVKVYNDAFDEYDFTSQSGVWVVNGLTSGTTYTLHATKDGYHSYTYSFTYDPGDFYHNFMMSPIVVDEEDVIEDVIEDVLEDDETMTEYYNEKFRDFAPAIWGFFMLMCLLFLMSILTSFNSGGKRR